MNLGKCVLGQFCRLCCAPALLSSMLETFVGFFCTLTLNIRFENFKVFGLNLF